MCIHPSLPRILDKQYGVLSSLEQLLFWRCRFKICLRQNVNCYLCLRFCTRIIKHYFLFLVVMLKKVVHHTSVVLSELTFSWIKETHTFINCTFQCYFMIKRFSYSDEYLYHVHALFLLLVSCTYCINHWCVLEKLVMAGALFAIFYLKCCMSQRTLQSL